MASKGQRRAVLIAGPTASGKSAAALDLAERIGGVIVNADAMQVYRELAILTARPSPADERRAPHRLFGHVPAAEAYSAGRWLADAERALREAWEEGRTAIVVGGTGLYFRVLEQGLVSVPCVPPDVRQAVRDRMAREGAAAMHADLARRAPGEAERVRPTDAQRIARALEVIEATGEPLTVHHSRAAGQGLLAGAEVERRLLLPERKELYRRCDARFLAMMQLSALEEVKGLLSMGLDPSLPAMKAIGVAALGRHLAGALSLGEAVALGQRDTRNYAKRQVTWLRHQMTGWPI